MMDYLGKMQNLELNIGWFIHLENSWSLAALHGCIISMSLASGFVF